jgi:hypothetical protein
MHRAVWWLDINVLEDCAATILNSKDRDSIVLQNIGIHSPQYTAQQPREPWILMKMFTNLTFPLKAADLLIRQAAVSFSRKIQFHGIS